MIIDDIIAGVVTAVTGAAVTTDNDSPAQFVEYSDGPLEESPSDRSFVIAINGTGPIDYTSLTGQTRRTVEMAVRVMFYNEGRSDTEFAKVIWQDLHRIQDRVFVYFNNGNVAGADNLRTDGNAVVTDSPEPRKKYASIPFVCEYTDDVVTS